MPPLRYRRRRFRFPRITRRIFRGSTNPKKKYNPRRFRRHLLSDTHANTHYRSIFAQGFVDNTAAAGSTTQVHFTKHLALPTTPTFWTSGGGAVAVDTGNPVPGFGRNIIIRGGRISIVAALRTTTIDTIKLTIFLVWRRPCSDDAIVPASGDASFLWDPSVQADFTRYGRVLKKWQAILEPQTGSSTVQVFSRLRPQKIDHENCEQAGSRLECILCAQKLTAATPGTVSVDVQVGHSLSFSGDEIS